jgi:hypothetical protein
VAALPQRELFTPEVPVPGAPLPVVRSRAVAVAVSATELLRPGSDLARLVEEHPHVDVLLATDDRPAMSEELDLDPDDLSALELADEVHRLGLAHVALHRLALPAPLDHGSDADLVAALSELVGFDPEPGVVCLAPTSTPTDPDRAAVDRAARRVARVYGLPLVRYRSLELTVVGGPPL